MKIIKQHLQANCYSRHEMRSVNGIVYHFISAKNITPDDPFNIDTILRILERYNFSAKYLIDRDGTVYELVPGLHRAYHAGKSRMNGRDYCNNFTIGVEFVGGTDYPYTDEQIISGIQLTAQLMTKHQFNLDWVQGHDRVRTDWNEAHPDDKDDVKVDPGDHFPWSYVRDTLQGADLAVRSLQ